MAPAEQPGLGSAGVRNHLPKASTKVSLERFVSGASAGQGPLWDRLLFERAGGYLAFLFHGLRATPDMVTALGGVCGVVGVTLLGTARQISDVVIAGALLLLAYSLDCADGHLARATGRTSARGAWLDVTVDAIVTAFLAASLAVALSTDQAGSPVTSLLLAGAFGASRTAGLFTWTQVRDTKKTVRRTGVGHVVRTLYGAAVQTPFVYALLCATRLSPTAFRTAILAVTVLTVGRTAVAARRHFREEAAGAATG
jgi:phosphatidylglycerophosphate synthase